MMWTEREREVIDMLLKGFNARQIAKQFAVSESEARAAVAEVLRKLAERDQPWSGLSA